MHGRSPDSLPGHLAPPTLHHRLVQRHGPVIDDKEALLRRVAPRRSLLGKPRLAPRGAELREGLTMLARGWPQDPRVQAVLARAARDPALVAALEGKSE